MPPTLVSFLDRWRAVATPMGTMSASLGAAGVVIADTTGPVISNVAAENITDTTATISWTTDEPADSQVDYGLATSYLIGPTTLDTTKVTSHSVNLTGLTQNTVYHFRVKSRDVAGNLTTGTDFTLTSAVTAVPANYDAALDLITGLSNHWRMEEVSGTVAAARVGAATGTYAGTISTDYTLALRGGLCRNNGYAVHFNGASGKVTFGDIIDATGTNQFWLSAMIRLDVDAPDVQMAIIDKQGGATREGWNLHIASRRIIFQRWQAGAADSCWGATVLNRREWYHVVATFDGTNMKVYVDGALDATTAGTVSVQNTAFNLSVGYADGLTFYPFYGTIHAVAAGTGSVPNGAAITALYDAASVATSTTTYYVSASGDDANPGTSLSPWRTLYQAGSGTVQAGDTVVFKDGVYTEVPVGQSVSRVRSPELLVNSGTKRSRITLKAENALGAQIKWTGVQDTWHGFVMMSTSYVTIQDFDVTQNAIGTSYADVFVRAWFKGVPDQSPNPSIGPNASADWDAYNAADHVIFTGLRIRNGYEPMKISHAHNCQLLNSTIEGSNLPYGSVNGSSPLIDGCTFLFNQASGQDSGPQFKGGTRSAVCRNSTFHHVSGADPMTTFIYCGGGSTDTGGLYDINVSTGFESYSPSIYNNVLYCDTLNDVTFGIIVQGAKDPYVCNNDILNTACAFRIQTGEQFLGGTLHTGVLNPPTAGGSTTKPKTQDPIIENNIVSNSAATSNYDILYATDAATDLAGTLTYDYNVLHNVANHQISQTHAPATTNPNFVNRASDWHVTSGSSAINAGVTLTRTDWYGVTVAVVTDRAAAARTGTWECGVYEGSV